ncbi:hypothetical protein [Neoaquamicrobium sediminum]|uniref:hypothetical protein n=1 Tax=Neoaquamicrobium sediminum TaxID=1849104 RepID=UPI001566CC44|nr:hypothetical protein [Mesorhizobium sediminum]NRC57301.1 hypothetical protein [Mesorhizobium sediminum]
MPRYTIETTYRLPIYRQQTYQAPTLEEACALALDDEDWTGGKEDHETSGATYVTGIWKGETDGSGPSLAIPEQFDEALARKADLFDDLVEVLKEPARVMGLSRDQFAHWLPRALTVLGRADNIVHDATGQRPARMPAAE